MSKANFYYFKPSGKWKYEGYGNIPDTNEVWTRQQLLDANEGKMPGLSSDGTDLVIIVIPDDDALHGWPQMKKVIGWS